VKLNKTNNYQH